MEETLRNISGVLKQKKMKKYSAYIPSFISEKLNQQAEINMLTPGQLIRIILKKYYENKLEDNIILTEQKGDVKI